MKLISGLTLAAMLSTGAMAQVPPALPPPAENPTPATPPAQPPVTLPPAEVTTPATNKPPAKAAAKKRAKKKTAVAKKTVLPGDTGIKPAVPLVINEPAVARQNNVNVRGQAKINSEIVTRLKQGDTVTVLEEITLPHPKTDEPAQWAKIAMPTNVHVFVNAPYVDENKAVKPAKLNVRSGPGENFSIVGMLHKGDTIKDVGTKGEWLEIEPPAGSFAFVAAHLLSHKEAETPMAPPVTMPVTNTEVAQNTPVVAPPTEPPPVTAPTNTATPPPVVTPPVPEPLPPPVEEPPQPRIVQREGIVRGTVSIQAPSYYELESLDTGKVTEYLYTTSTNLALKHWKGKTVLVTGEEGLDERWPNTPVITIQKLQLVQ
jgi:uncharacterized protein YgiM (DUF1202 family)